MGNQLHHLRKLNETDLDTALMVLAEHGGNSEKAHRQLVEMWGEEKAPSDSTLRRWRNERYPERYIDIAAGMDQARKDKRIIQGFREIVQRSQDGIASTLNRLDGEIDNLEPKDLSATAQRLAVIAGIASEKTLLYEGRPTVITESRSPDWYEQQLAALTTEGTAEEIHDAELVEGPEHEG